MKFKIKNSKLKTFLTTLCLGALVVSSRAASYSVTNDLQVSFNVFYWTNSAGTNYVSLSSTNLAPASNTVFTVAATGPVGLGLQATNATAALFVPLTNLPASGCNVSAAVAVALSIVQPLSEQVPQNQSVLKSYFITGAVPGENNYWEFVDTMFWYVNAAYTNSLVAATNAAASAASAAASALSGVACHIKVSAGFNSSLYTITTTTGCAPNYYGYSAGELWQFTFTHPFANANYIVLGTGGTAYVKTAAYLNVTIPLNTTVDIVLIP
jgi:hypothetical protein